MRACRRDDLPVFDHPIIDACGELCGRESHAASLSIESLQLFGVAR
jgi:hypothetical protein